MRSRPPQTRRGALLLVVLVVIALLTIANLSYFDWTFAERRAANAVSRRAQSQAAADSAIEMLRVWLSQEPPARDNDGGWRDNPARFRALLVSDSPAAELRSRAAVVAPAWGADAIEGARFGLEDESGRLNLNTLVAAEARQEGAGRAQLLALPGMTEAIAESILDWIDEDDDPRPQGAERDYYATRDPPYAPTNGPPETIEQLLLVKDVTPELLWGLDQDRNHTVSEAEATSIGVPPGVAPGELNGGWASLLTLDSVEANTRPDGEPKINLNGGDLEQLYRDLESALGSEEARFVIAYRQNGVESDGVTDSGSGAGRGAESSQGSAGVSDSEEDDDSELDFDAPAVATIGDPLELIGATVRVAGQGGQSPSSLQSPWGAEDVEALNNLLDTVTTVDAETLPGRINLNEAPRPVLVGVPGMPPSIVDAILAARDPSAGTANPDRRHAIWLLTDGFVDLEQMREIAPYVTGSGAAFRAQVLGGWESGGPVVRQEVVIDTTASPPRVARRRDLSQLGAGFDPAQVFSPEGVSSR